MKKVLYIGQMSDMSGYGNAARNYIKCFDLFLHKEKEIDFKVFDVSYEKSDAKSKEETELLDKYLIKEYSSFLDKDTVVIVHLLPMFFSSKTWQEMRKYVDSENVYSSIAWEPNRLPTSWVEFYQQNNIQKFIVYCSYTRECFLSHGFEEDKVILLPHPVMDFENSNSSLIEKDKFRILSVSQWDERKNWDLLIQAVSHEFFFENDVELFIKTFRFEHIGADPNSERNFIISQAKQFKSKVTHYGQPTNVKINLLCGLIEKKEIVDLYRQSTVYCLPTKCDSFGLTIGEAVLSKRVAIVPDKGGHIDYFAKDNQFLVKSEMMPVRIGKNMFSTIDMEMVETDYNDLRRKLRLAYDMWKKDPNLLENIAEENYDFAVENYIDNEKIFKIFLDLVRS